MICMNPRMAHATEAWQLVRQHVGEQTAEISSDRTSSHILSQEFVLHVILDDVVTLPEVELADGSACCRCGGVRSRPWSWIRPALTCAVHDIASALCPMQGSLHPAVLLDPSFIACALVRDLGKMYPVVWVFRYRHYTRFSSGSLRIFLTPLGCLLNCFDIPPRLLELALVPHVAGAGQLTGAKLSARRKGAVPRRI